MEHKTTKTDQKGMVGPVELDSRAELETTAKLVELETRVELETPREELKL